VRAAPGVDRTAAGDRKAAASRASADDAASGVVMTSDGQPPMVDEQAVIAFLRQLDRGLSTALRADEQQRLRRLVLTQAVVMAVLADPRHLDQALRQAADSLAQIDP
jgi:hypothetical protein